jgi:hypothetical protein
MTSQKKTIHILKCLVTAILFCLSCVQALSITCSDVLNSTQNSQTSLLTFSEQIHEFTDMYDGIQLLRSAVPRRHSNPSVDIFEASKLPNYDGELPITGINLKRGQLSANRLSPFINWGPYSGGHFRKALISGDTIPNLFVSVHSIQSSPLDYMLRPFGLTWHMKRQGFTNRLVSELLSQEEFQDTPRLFLASKEFKISNLNFLNQASAVYYSIAGEIVGPLPLSENYHVVGEQFSACLSRAVQRLVELVLLKSKNISSNIFIHSDHVLEVNGDGVNLDSVTHLFPLRASLEEYGAEALIRAHLIPSYILPNSYNSQGKNDHFVISYNTSEDYLEILNLLTNSRVRVFIL